MDAKAGGQQTITIAATNQSAGSTIALVDMEVYDETGTRLDQQYWNNQSFAPNQTLTFQATWTVPSTAASGTVYTVKIGIFSTDWSTLYSWNDAAAKIMVH